MLDLGVVRDIAEVTLNERLVGVRCWRPYRFDVSSFVRAGCNQIRVLVTNSMGNRMNRTTIPSGLFGPVVIVPYKKYTMKLVPQK